jgi:exopolysaccharide biosynthesis polyprenyl glycosylphosphotransferase
MLYRNRQIRMQILQVKDLGLFVLALWLAHLIRSHLPGDWLGLRWEEIAPFNDFTSLIWIILPAPFLLESLGFYKRPLNSTRTTTLWILFKTCLIVTIGVILIMFLFRMFLLARGVIILFGGISLVLLFVADELLRLAYKSRFAQLQANRSFILVGTPDDALRLRSELKSKSTEGIEIKAELDLNESTVERLIHLLHEHSANGVIINAKHTYFGQIEKAIQACELEGVEAWLMADFFNTQISRTSFDDFYGRPVMVFRTVPEDSWQVLAKQVIDVLGAFFALLVSALFFLVVALFIKLTSPGPVFFRQKRCGLNGQPFTMLKFRSMVSDAEQHKSELEALNEMDGPVFKVTNDPRVTRVGRFLRKWSIDEWPQLINVLRGEMSLVGPRPLPVDEVNRFDNLSHRRRLSVKPGLTCLWQISGRNNVRDFKDWVRLDLEYIDNWSLWLDFKILCRTVPAVLIGTGAK